MASVGGWVSPPELDGSGGTTTTSSKSSSQPSSFQLDDGGVCGDLGHFEEIGLDDDDHHDSHQHKLQQQQQQHAHSREVGIGRRGVGKMRELTQKKPPILTEHHLGPPPPPPLRCRPPTAASSSASPASAGLSSKNAHRSPSPTMLRRASPAGRKTVEEIENEYDSDDDVPPDTIFYNVPLSPRSARALSAAASPDRDTAGVQLPLPGETAIPPASGKEARGGREGSQTEFPGKSWSDAMEQLGDEAKELSEALERHADLEMEQTERRLQMSCEKNRSSSSVGSGTVVGAAHTIVTSQNVIRRSTTTVTSTVPPPLPPLQLTNGMIDPLPISKEKEAVLSRTRPSWLPPKSKEEEKRHLKEYKQMMRLSQQADRKRAEKERMDQEYKDRAKVDMHKLWDQHIIPNWDIATRKSETRELWWQGIAPRCRGTAWQLAFGNSLAVGSETFRLALKRAREVENGLKKSPTMYSFRERDLFGAIRRDVGKTFPELKIFQETGPLHQSLLEVLMAYSMYRSDVGYAFGTHVVAGLLLLNLSPEESFVSLVNLLNRPLPLAFYTRDDAAMSRVYDLFLKAFNYKLPSLFQHIHMFLNIPPSLYLEAMFVTLFTLHCPIDIASRIWDVYSFEGDSVLVRAAIAVLTVLEPKLYGDADEIVGVLGWGAKGYWELGREDTFMALVRQAGRGEPS